MEIIIGIVLYILTITVFIAFGNFLKECDHAIPSCNTRRSRTIFRRHRQTRKHAPIQHGHTVPSKQMMA